MICLDNETQSLLSGIQLSSKEQDQKMLHLLGEIKQLNDILLVNKQVHLKQQPSYKIEQPIILSNEVKNTTNLDHNSQQKSPLNLLNKSDITEMKSINHPVPLVLEVTKLIFQLINKTSPDTNVNWKDIKKMLGENFIHQLINLDMDHLNENQLKVIKKSLQIDADKIKTVSKACYFLLAFLQELSPITNNQ